MKAFPIQEVWDNEEYYGMDLRDYFAAKAMQAIIQRCDEKSSEIQEMEIWVGNYAYAAADSMMKAREK